MAPWFEESCKEARKKYRELKRAHGKKHAVVRAAFVEYKTTCKKSRAAL
jgi:hypothetical protein